MVDIIAIVLGVIGFIGVLLDIFVFHTYFQFFSGKETTLEKIALKQNTKK